MTTQNHIECELITVHGSFHGFIYTLNNSWRSREEFYFRSRDTLDSTRYKYLEHKFKSLESLQRDGRKEFKFEPYEVLAKNFLLKSNSVEIFDQNANKSYFFNFFSTDRQKAVLDMFREYG